MDGSHSGSNAPPPFLTKTYEMIDDQSTNSIVSWSSTGTSFVVWNPLEFSRDLLPKFFKHNNFSSFVRQLNTYGFRKIDPDQWEFANEGFIRGQRHLLKNIHRRKPIHSHSLQQGQGNSSGALDKSIRQELEDEIERLKHEKNLLISELQNHTQERQGMELRMQSLGERLNQMEHRLQQMMSFLAQIMQKPGFVYNLMQQPENHGKKRRLPIPNYFHNEADMQENRVVAFQAVSRDKSDAFPILMLNMEPFEKLESTLNSWENFLHGVGQASGEEMYNVGVSMQPSAVILTEMHASSGDTDMNMQPQSPQLHPSSPHSREIQSSVELAESTSYEESPIISSLQVNADIRTKDSGIDVNAKPTAPETDSSKEQEVETTTSAVPTGVNDVFWEQFLTETPGPSDAQEVQSERRDSERRKNDNSNPTDRGRFWWNTKNVDNLTEQMGHLTPAERT